MADQKINFTRSRNGYDPQEVDAVLIELQKQIIDLKQRNVSLSSAVTQYGGKIREMLENTKQLQNERVQESLRLSGLMSNAAKTAEKIERDALYQADEITENARRKAEEIVDAACQETEKTLENARRDAETIRNQAQVDFVSVRLALMKLSESTQTIRQNNDQYIAGSTTRLAEIESLVTAALNDIPATAASFAPHAFAPLQPQQNAVDPFSADAAEGSDPYEDFVQKMKSAD